MIKSDLINVLSNKHTQLNQNDVKLAIECILDTMTKTLADNGRIEVRGFGSFSVRQRSARMARNPRTGEMVSLSERNAIHFKVGKGLKLIVNSKTN